MTSDLALDSSLLVKLAVPEADTAKAEKVTPDVTAAGGQLIAIDFALVEVGQAL